MEEQEAKQKVETVDNPVENKKEEAKKEEERMFTRAELNKAIVAEREKAIEKARKEFEAEKTEAERLAKLSSEERTQEEIRKLTDRANSAEAKLNAYQLKEQTLKDNTDVPVELINLIDFSKDNTAELVKNKLETIKQAYKKAVEMGVNESLKEKTPVTKLQDTVTKKENVSRFSI